MKNVRLFVPVALAMLVAFIAVGCGSAASSGGGGGGSLGSGGKLSDPYISEAILGVRNASGTFDAGMIVTTDATGGFSFPAGLAIGSTIEMLSMGTHLGASYEGEAMKFIVDGSGNLNMTPLTNWITHGVSEGAIAALISSAGISIQASNIGSDPMAGLSDIITIDSDAVNKVKSIKAAIFAYSVSRIANDLFPTGYTQGSLETTIMKTIEAAIATAVNSGISDTLLISINNQIDSMNTTLASYSLEALPHATADQVSRSAFNIAQYIAYMKINKSSTLKSYDWWPAGFDAKIALYGQSLGMRYYFMDNYNYGVAVDTHGAFPAIDGKKSIVIGLEQGSGISDGFGKRITTMEVNPGSPNNVKGFDIITTDGATQGTIEALTLI